MEGQLFAPSIGMVVSMAETISYTFLTMVNQFSQCAVIIINFVFGEYVLSLFVCQEIYAEGY